MNSANIPDIENPEFVNLLRFVGILDVQEVQNLLEKFHDNALLMLIHLVNEGRAKKDELCRLWGDSIGFAYVDLEKTLFQPDIAHQIPESFARKRNLIGVYKFGESVTVAASDPANIFVQKDTEQMLGFPVSLVFAFPPDIADAIEIQYKSADTLDEFVSKIKLHPLFNESETITPDQISAIAEDESVGEFIRGLLLFGIKERASHIHIEPGERSTRIRFRINGALEDRMRLDSLIHDSLVSGLKLLADANISETHGISDGRVSLSLVNRTVEFGFSVFPTIYGEKITIQIWRELRNADIPDISALGFSKSVYSNVRELTQYPQGLFLVTGPADSGKRTTLYSILRDINRPTVNIMTIEDTVEYRLEGANQVQTDPQTGLDFPSGLRAFLRQDPDIILLGEIRDKETADMSCRAALSGIKVFTSLYARDSAEGLIRLIELGTEPSLITSSLIAVMAQRLVRRLCERCREEYELTPDEIENIFVWDQRTKVFFCRKKGCLFCSHTGFSGRIGIHELLFIDHNIRRLITNRTSVSDIRENARQSGFQTIRYDGMKKVLRRLTTIEEINWMIGG